MKYRVKLAVGMMTALCAGAASAVSLESKIVKNYADIAYATYADALATAQDLQAAVDALVKEPSAETMAAAKAAWKVSRIPYQQSEVFRFGNPVVDDWEGGLNAWPLDEGLIDYVDQGTYIYELGNPGATLNIVATPKLEMGGQTIDMTELTPELLSSLNEFAGSEANVATGYHAIEFLLWGQDLHGSEAGAGDRPFTDYVTGTGCTHGNCDRRGQYLQAATQLLVNDLEWMTRQWQADVADNYRAELLAEPEQQVIRKMLFGMGSLALGELAGERMKVALEANSTEDEHDCFSDNTHNSHFYDAQGIRNIYYGTYIATDGKKTKGASLRKLLRKTDKALSKQLDADFKATTDALTVMVKSAEQDHVAFDQMIAPENEAGHEIIRQAIAALVTETQGIENAANALGITNLNPDTADHEF
ncbi:imelysin family protein [Gynuella sunshinyii]|uniref:Putative iron-regulated protein n=1 Tax=Gynuella sunshinyii YC6258 TaxID=1445510 RepID=A0A0C5VR70_9GAMM|nr:imelysin family protein [Gynuella sunshinyii]AJQ96736.1 putative iron-regulated protein [Gynuella sunshinyii YC6258]